MAREWRVHPDYVRKNLSIRQLLEMEKVFKTPSNMETYIAWAILNIVGTAGDVSGMTIADFLLNTKKQNQYIKVSKAELAAMLDNLAGLVNNG